MQVSVDLSKEKYRIKSIEITETVHVFSSPEQIPSEILNSLSPEQIQDFYKAFRDGARVAQVEKSVVFDTSILN